MNKRYLIVLRDRRGFRYRYIETAATREQAIEQARSQAQTEYGHTGRFQTWTLVSAAMIEEVD